LAPSQISHAYIYYYFETSDSAETAPTQEPWTASVQVKLCDSTPGAGAEPTCFAQSGIVVNVSRVNGDFLGSCTSSEPYPTPWGVDISTCEVPGMPFNQDIIASQDPATIPAGYAPME